MKFLKDITWIQELKQIKSGKKELRSFGLQMAGIFAILAIVLAVSLIFFKASWKLHQFSLALSWAIAFFLVLGLWAPGILKPIQKAWMGLAILMGLIISPIILTLLYMVTITPIGLVLRLKKTKLLDLTFRDPQPSYWIVREKQDVDKKKYEVQY